MSSHSQEKNTETVVQDMIGLPDNIQVEKIADQFSQVSNAYSPLKTADIDIERISDDRPSPEINPYIIYLKIMSIKKKTCTLSGDVPMKVIKFCAEEISFPLSDIYDRAVSHGEYPDLYKMEIVTPAPKCYPPQTAKDLRKISGTLNFSKILESIIAEYMVGDMRPSRDPSQYGNCKGVSTGRSIIL
jgi:hypothetical protein